MGRVGQKVFIVDGVRTPIGKYAGALARVRPDDLAAHVIEGLRERNPGLKERLDQVVFGATNQAGEDNRNVARMGALLAGLPFEVPAVTVNRLCGSGLEAVNDAARRIALGEARSVIAGGVESMSRAPYSMPKAEFAYSRGAPPLYDTSLGWRYPNPRMEERFPLLSMGQTAERVAEKYGVSRADQDAFAVESHRKACRAWDENLFASEILPVEIPQRKGPPKVVSRDESPRADSSLDALAGLKPVFQKDGTVTAGNSSPLNDGAAALWLVNEETVHELGLEATLMFEASAEAGVHPDTMGEGPIPATRSALARAGWAASDLDCVELNEAFAAQALACVRELELDPERVNVRGGAISLGHPIGCSGARIVVTLLHAMAERPAGKRALASLCIGVGQGIATLFQRV